MRRLLIFMSAVLLLGIAIAGVFYFYYRNSPRYALQQMVTSLMRRNYDKFYSHLDMPSILGSLTQDTGQDLIPPELIPKNNLLGTVRSENGQQVCRASGAATVRYLRKGGSEFD